MRYNTLILVKALVDISRSTLCCDSNETRAPIANPLNSVQLYRTPPTIAPTYIRVRAVVWERGEGQTDTQTRVTNPRFASSTTHEKCSVQFTPATKLDSFVASAV